MTPAEAINVMMVVNVLLVITVIIWKAKTILSFLYPQNYVDVVMIESDNNIRTWLQKKNADLRFKFNDGTYILGKPVYRRGRLPLLIFKEGLSNSIDVESLKILGDTDRASLLSKLDLAKLFIKPNDFMSMIKKNWWLFALLIIGMIIFMYSNSGAPVN